MWWLFGIAAVLLESYAAFWLLDLTGSFISVNGLFCVLGSIVADGALVVAIVLKYDELHASFTSNPHSRIGHALRGGGVPHEPPPSRAAWDGGWEDPAQAADKMKADR